MDGVFCLGMIDNVKMKRMGAMVRQPHITECKSWSIDGSSLHSVIAFISISNCTRYI